MNKIWCYFQEIVLFKLIFPILFKYIAENLITMTEEMKQAKKENNIPKLEDEYQQLPILRSIYSLLFNYLHSHLVNREELIKQSQAENNLYQLIYQETINIEQTINYQVIPSALKEKEGKFTFTTPFAVVVNNVELFGIYAMGFNKDRNIILETALDRVDCLEHSAISTLKQGFNLQYILPETNIEHIDLACSLVNYWSHLYAHWIYEALTRLEALEHYTQTTGKKPILIIDKNPPTWKIRSLELMGYKPEDYIQWNGYRAKINQIVICSKRREEGRTSIKASRWVRERILSNIDSYANSNLLLSQNIFISRKKAKSRRILNEEEVINILAKMNFIPYVLEDIDWQDQVKIFAQAKIIVAPHGAGLTNMLFSQRATIIEIFGQKISHFHYTISRGLGFNHGCIFCEEKDGNIMIDCGELSKLISRMLKEKF